MSGIEIDFSKPQVFVVRIASAKRAERRAAKENRTRELERNRRGHSTRRLRYSTRDVSHERSAHKECNSTLCDLSLPSRAPHHFSQPQSRKGLAPRRGGGHVATTAFLRSRMKSARWARVLSAAQLQPRISPAWEHATRQLSGSKPGGNQGERLCAFSQLSAPQHNEVGRSRAPLAKRRSESLWEWAKNASSYRQRRKKKEARREAMERWRGERVVDRPQDCRVQRLSTF